MLAHIKDMVVFMYSTPAVDLGETETSSVGRGKEWHPQKYHNSFVTI